MAGLTSQIERFLREMLEEGENGMIEIGRNELAERFSCAPSQINYVLTTRFTPYNGYYTESRRGGAGYIRIIRLERTPKDLVTDVISEEIQDAVTMDKTRRILRAFRDRGMLSEREQQIMLLAVSDHALSVVPPGRRNAVRASVLKNMLILFLR